MSRHDPSTSPRSRRQVLPEVAWRNIETSGSYLLIDFGVLVRIPAHGLGQDGVALGEVTAFGGTRVAQLTADADTEVEPLRGIARAAGYRVAF